MVSGLSRGIPVGLRDISGAILMGFMGPRKSQEHFERVPGVFQRVSRGYRETTGEFPGGPSVLEWYDVSSDA